jgi:hypothetical protein
MKISKKAFKALQKLPGLFRSFQSPSRASKALQKLPKLLRSFRSSSEASEDTQKLLRSFQVSSKPSKPSSLLAIKSTLVQPFNHRH